ncbi:metalloregulator ArsR/SmtB family transcription factor [Paenibacillus sp. FSL E2-8871]|jgi:DNA-binding transcriptional ArsR family regulator|uniref:Transcriptional regulator n=2 Tax=Paenibacillus TaxID=44249 RepID=A0A1R0ZJA5_9BACL|nr:MULTISPECIES: metalloregulator ArsR/SmtB family transcription factor [Paenibacillus]MBY3619844.1 winged helix-turn-helix transcriptional regulator [Acinetobacter sp. CUI P1]AIQ22681.1 transcriptional regulator [Paenibacillus sp. FSL H7-0737]KAA1177555.1 winged helix-turn-helix transcriptional regulator [Paenibacillus sp. B2(2019)]OMD55007.1 transcriptional regulator [Paenibacillus odorifer]OME71419.1 transcriptional regulator [Paenibacillus odorifer]
MDKNFKAYNQTAETLKAIAHPVRLCIIKGLLEKGSCNVSFMQDCLDLPQSTVSQHLQKLRALGIVETERNGLEINYSVKDEKIKHLIQLFLGEE